MIVILELGGFKVLKIKNSFLIVILELGGFKWFKNNKKRKKIEIIIYFY